MKLSLIICTYMRPQSLKNLLLTIEEQTQIPDEVLIVDGSTDGYTKEMIVKEAFEKRLALKYFKVPDNERGLTKQRNYGVKRVGEEIDIVAFLDDDIELDKYYFEKILEVYNQYNNTVAVGGVTTNEVTWQKTHSKECESLEYFCFAGWKRRDDIRYRMRKKLGLVSPKAPGKVVSFGHERSIGFLPPTGKTYETDFLMGGIASYRKSILTKETFSSFFEGYGLYEDKDFSLRIRKYGKIYINTSAKCEHHHDPLGRPDYIKYGTMVVWNGWRVWRVATPHPGMKDRVKWWSITILLTYMRLGNAVMGPKRKIALEDFTGRHVGMIRLLFGKPSLD